MKFEGKFAVIPTLAICIAVYVGISLSNYNAPARPHTTFLGLPCIVDCSISSELAQKLQQGMNDSLVVIAQEVGSLCCAMLGYDNNGKLGYCENPELLQQSGAYKGLQNFHCGDFQLFTFYEQVEFRCNNSEVFAIKNKSLANAYTIAFALMRGFNCS